MNATDRTPANIARDQLTVALNEAMGITSPVYVPRDGGRVMVDLSPDAASLLAGYIIGRKLRHDEEVGDNEARDATIRAVFDSPGSEEGG